MLSLRRPSMVFVIFTSSDRTWWILNVYKKEILSGLTQVFVNTLTGCSGRRCPLKFEKLNSDTGMSTLFIQWPASLKFVRAVAESHHGLHDFPMTSTPRTTCFSSTISFRVHPRVNYVWNEPLTNVWKSRNNTFCRSWSQTAKGGCWFVSTI